MKKGLVFTNAEIVSKLPGERFFFWNDHRFVVGIPPPPKPAAEAGPSGTKASKAKRKGLKIRPYRLAPLFQSSMTSAPCFSMIFELWFNFGMITLSSLTKWLVLGLDPLGLSLISNIFY